MNKSPDIHFLQFNVLQPAGDKNTWLSAPIFQDWGIFKNADPGSMIRKKRNFYAGTHTIATSGLAHHMAGPAVTSIPYADDTNINIPVTDQERSSDSHFLRKELTFQTYCHFEWSFSKP